MPGTAVLEFNSVSACSFTSECPYFLATAAHLAGAISNIAIPCSIYSVYFVSIYPMPTVSSGRVRYQLNSKGRTDRNFVIRSCSSFGFFFVIVNNFLTAIIVEFTTSCSFGSVTNIIVVVTGSIIAVSVAAVTIVIITTRDSNNNGKKENDLCFHVFIF